MIVLTVTPGVAAASALTSIKQLAWEFPGGHELTICAGARELAIGPVWTYDASPGCMAALQEYGHVEVAAC